MLSHSSENNGHEEQIFFPEQERLEKLLDLALRVNIHSLGKLVEPEFTFRSVNWTEHTLPEDFSFSRCRVSFQEQKYDSLIYYPHPETKIRHFQNPSILEILAPLIQEIIPNPGSTGRDG
ncbi:MAG: hypothetical protein J7545_14050 [Roseofilum sp. SBFL]|uniref:hypothetical protein n=1 Tax=unclassified Roseofilum TaxID=2620099 RepID=UPI001AFE0273|nr:MULTISPECIES: hypothetical protein [unclassified Roseofilum]MBP0012578.1 hypothetical protein [Roseofilum sp. SID3]MBP0022821.1 hypothetical protein [Roseofilum sp. SID2]MBP0038197.1 hypothetical protein [Roseofilum sp. SID1]MBP0043072.1 hypothetical protein [Roseofilum sp. SBFL]